MKNLSSYVAQMLLCIRFCGTLHVPNFTFNIVTAFSLRFHCFIHHTLAC